MQTESNKPYDDSGEIGLAHVTFFGFPAISFPSCLSSSRVSFALPFTWYPLLLVSFLSPPPTWLCYWNIASFFPFYPP